MSSVPQKFVVFKALSQIFVDLRYLIDVCSHAALLHVRTATPRALSVENCGGQKTAGSAAQLLRSSEFDAHAAGKHDAAARDISSSAFCRRADDRADAAQRSA